MPYFMLRSAQKVPPVDGHGDSGEAGVNVSAGDAPRFTPGL